MWQGGRIKDGEATAICWNKSLVANVLGRMQQEHSSPFGNFSHHQGWPLARVDNLDIVLGSIRWFPQGLARVVSVPQGAALFGGYRVTRVYEGPKNKFV